MESRLDFFPNLPRKRLIVSKTELLDQCERLKTLGALPVEAEAIWKNQIEEEYNREDIDSSCVTIGSELEHWTFEIGTNTEPEKSIFSEAPQSPFEFTFPTQSRQLLPQRKLNPKSLPRFGLREVACQTQIQFPIRSPSPQKMFDFFQNLNCQLSMKKVKEINPNNLFQKKQVIIQCDLLEIDTNTAHIFSGKSNASFRSSEFSLNLCSPPIHRSIKKCERKPHYRV